MFVYTNGGSCLLYSADCVCGNHVSQTKYLLKRTMTQNECEFACHTDNSCKAIMYDSGLQSCRLITEAAACYVDPAPLPTVKAFMKKECKIRHKFSASSCGVGSRGNFIPFENYSYERCTHICIKRGVDCKDFKYDSSLKKCTLWTGSCAKAPSTKSRHIFTKV